MISIWHGNLKRYSPSASVAQFFKRMLPSLPIVSSRVFDSGSHCTPGVPPLAQAGFPHASACLLMRYLQLHPTTLRGRLTTILKRGQGAGRWNVPLLCQWMQVVTTTFLEYHGPASRDTLQVCATATERRP